MKKSCGNSKLPNVLKEFILVHLGVLVAVKNFVQPNIIKTQNFKCIGHGSCFDSWIYS